MSKKKPSGDYTVLKRYRFEFIEEIAERAQEEQMRLDPNRRVSIPDYHKEAWEWWAAHEHWQEVEEKSHGKEARYYANDRMIDAYKMFCWSIDVKLCGKIDCTKQIPEQRKYCSEDHRLQQKAYRQRKRYPERTEEAKRKYYRSGG